MPTLSFKEFSQLASQGNLIPLSQEFTLDMETPVAALLKAQASPYSFLLESIEGGERWGRFSFLGFSPRLILQAQGSEWSLARREQRYLKPERGQGNPLLRLKEELARFQWVPDPALPRLCGGAVGYLGYDCIRYFESIEDQQHPGMDYPDCFFGIYDRMIIFDNLSHAAYAVVNVHLDGKQSPKTAYQKALKDLDRLTRQFQKPLGRPPRPARKRKKPFAWRASLSEGQFQQMVLKAQEYIKAGDIFQVVLSMRWKAEASLEPLSVYRALRRLNPSPYLFCLRMGDYSLVGSSPEVMVRLENGKVTVRPIAGTRRRGRDEADDRAMEGEMLADPKERAEHIMLVDLGRNDVGRVSEPGSVRVTDLMSVEKYSHVMHMVSNVEGELQPGRDAFDVIAASFPAGTLSGAPKIRAMGVIEELEPVKRGFYGGCVGYIDFAGNSDMAITIRSIAMNSREFFVQAGAGVVYDSKPELEYKECHNKARAVMEAVRLVLEGKI